MQEDFMGSEQRTLPRPPPEMKQALPTAPDAVAAFNASMAAFYQQVGRLAFCALCLLMR